MADTEINIIGRQCLGRRLQSQPVIVEDVAACEVQRNTRVVAKAARYYVSGQ
jgi:hypothetical protein